MRLPILSAAMLSCLAGPALAADLAPLPTKAPAYTPAPPPYLWTGLYVGGHVGYAGTWLSGSGLAGGLPGSASGTLQGFLGGIQAGYNYQLPSAIVLGIEGDYSFSDVHLDHNVPAVGPGAKVHLKSDYYATLAGRAGYAIDRLLLYVKGGAAWTTEKVHFSAPGLGAANGTFDRFGFVLGAGAEYALWDHWSVKAEYNFLDFGTKTQTLSASPIIGPTKATIKSYTHMGKFGINYTF